MYGIISLISAAVGIASGISAMIFAIVAYSRSKRLDNSAAGEKSGTVLAEIGYIRSGIDDIKSEQREQRRMNTNLCSRITALEESNKQAHIRIERAERQIEHYHMDNV